MRPLRLVGLSDDGAFVVLESDDGDRFSVPRDEALTSLLAQPDATRSDTSEPPALPPIPRIGAPVTNTASTLTPREIQTRVRAGESPEALAEESGTAIDRVMRFAEPVLQERFRVTDEARRGKARRGGDGALVLFGELADHRFLAHGIDPSSVLWDAYRREDGGWTVTARFTGNDEEHQARFAFALTNRTVSAVNEIASDLLSGGQIKALLPPAPPPVLDPEPAATPPVRLTSVPDLDPESAVEQPIPLRPPGGRQRAHTRHMPVSVDEGMVEAEPELFDQAAFDDWDEPSLPLGDDVRPPRSYTPQPSRYAPEPAQAATPAPSSERSPERAPATEPAAPAPAASAEAGAADRAHDDRAHDDRAHDDRAHDDPNQGAAQRRKPGDKPKMPSWDDILLGVRRKD